MPEKPLDHLSDRELLIQVATTVEQIRTSGCSKYPEHVHDVATQREQIRSLRYDLNAVRDDRKDDSKERRHSRLAVVSMIISAIACMASVTAVIVALVKLAH